MTQWRYKTGMHFSKILVSFAAAFAGAALAGDLGPDGVDTKPVCGVKSTMLKIINDNYNDTPTGIKGFSKDWEMELAADTQDGSWTLTGRSLKAGAQQNILCLLNSDVLGFPADVVKEAFYLKYFSNVPANKALIEKAMVEAKQRK